MTAAKTMAEVVMPSMGCDRRAHYGNVEQPYCGKHGHYGQWPCPEAVAVADALAAAGFGLVVDAKAEALEEAAAQVMGPSEYLADRATCHNITNDLRARAAALRGQG